MKEKIKVEQDTDLDSPIAAGVYFVSYQVYVRHTDELLGKGQEIILVPSDQDAVEFIEDTVVYAIQSSIASSKINPNSGFHLDVGVILDDFFIHILNISRLSNMIDPVTLAFEAPPNETLEDAVVDLYSRMDKKLAKKDQNLLRLLSEKINEMV